MNLLRIGISGLPGLLVLSGLFELLGLLVAPGSSAQALKAYDNAGSGRNQGNSDCLLRLRQFDGGHGRILFLGDLQRNRVDEIVLFSRDLLDEATDSLYVFPMCRDDFDKVHIVGQGFDEEMVADEVLTKVI